MTSCRASGDGDEFAIAAEVVHVIAGPRDRGFDVNDLAGPAMSGTGAVLNGQTHPTHFHEVSHQFVALQDAAAENPCSPWDEDQHRRGADEICATPHIEQLTGLLAVGHRRTVDAAATVSYTHLTLPTM